MYQQFLMTARPIKVVHAALKVCSRRIHRKKGEKYKVEPTLVERTADASHVVTTVAASAQAVHTLVLSLLAILEAPSLRSLSWLGRPICSRVGG